MKTEDYATILETAGIRPTSTRLLIYEAIASQTDTFSLGTLENSSTASTSRSSSAPSSFSTSIILSTAWMTGAAHTNIVSATTTANATKAKSTAISTVRYATIPIA